MKKHVDLIGYACGDGAENKDTEFGPIFCEQNDLSKSLNSIDITSSWNNSATSNKKLSPEISILEANIKLSNNVKQSLKNNNFPITIGGDHSMAIGTWHGVITQLNAAKKFGLLWVDAHMDAHTINSSPSKNIHGMPLAFLLGKASGLFAEELLPEQLLSTENTVLFGIRSYEEEEKSLLEKLNIRIYFMDEINKRGVITCWQEAIKQAQEAPKGYGLTIDIDAIDPTDAPGTGTIEPNGLLAKDLLQLLSNSSLSNKLSALEIAEFNPSLDNENKTYQLIKDIIINTLRE